MHDTLLFILLHFLHFFTGICMANCCRYRLKDHTFIFILGMIKDLIGETGETHGCQ